MSEKGSPFINFLAHLIFGAAQDHHAEEDVVEGLVSAHQLNDASGKHHPFVVMNSEVRSIVAHEVDKADAVAAKMRSKPVGYVNFKDKRSGPAVQTLAERVDAHVSDKKRKDALKKPTVENAKRTVQEIMEEIADRNGWK